MQSDPTTDNGNFSESWVMRIDGMQAVRSARFSQSSCYLPYDCRQRALVLHLLFLLLFLPAAHSLTYFVGTSGNQMGRSTGQEEPFLSKDDKQTIVMFCRAALSNPLNREKGNEISRETNALVSKVPLLLLSFSDDGCNIPGPALIHAIYISR
ncbi:hypothetical protein RB195_000602 [Necator americanus]|uniref:Uncharacterized protein n=1 Tax=Necator americanus TaxID=51031 RepID=A0ABR1DC79_NECAM